MASDQTTTYPLETMTETQRDVFCQLIESRRQIPINIKEPIWLALLLAGEKPGALLTTLSPPTPSAANDPPSPDITTRDIATAFDLFFLEWDKHIIYISRRPWRLELLPSQIGTTDAHAYRLGFFFGYPIEDINHFINTNPCEKQPEDLASEEAFSPQELAYTTFLPQRHDDSIQRYERAIRDGKEIHSTIIDCANKWELPQLKDYVDQIYEAAFTKYSSSPT